MKYTCRTCGFLFSTETPINKCPQCSSICIVPENYKQSVRRRVGYISWGDRLSSMVLGVIGGLLTFLFWTIAIAFKGGAMAGKGASAALFFGVVLSVGMAVLFGMVGLLFGGEKLTKLLAIVWGTDKEFSERFRTWIVTIPEWTFYLLWGVIMTFALGFLYSQI